MREGTKVTNEVLGDAPFRTAAMISRRGMCGLVAGLAVLPLPGVSAGVFAAELPTARDDIRYVLTDERHPESLQFAAVFERRGVARLEVTDGLTRLWRDALVPLWREKSGAIAGLTRRETWVCVAEQARSCRRKSILSARHGMTMDGRVTEHFVSGSRPTLADATLLQSCGTAWPTAVADLALHCTTASGAAGDHGRFRVGPAAEDAAPSSFLVSWVIA